jgi:hypothetical protein
MVNEPTFPEPGRTPGKAEGSESEDQERRAAEEPGFTPDQAEGEREIEDVNLGE